jgi:hypothetical protein
VAEFIVLGSDTNIVVFVWFLGPISLIHWVNYPLLIIDIKAGTYVLGSF